MYSKLDVVYSLKFCAPVFFSFLSSTEVSRTKKIEKKKLHFETKFLYEPNNAIQNNFSTNFFFVIMFNFLLKRY